MAKPPPPRITLLTAQNSPVIVGLCRVRHQLWRIVSLDAKAGAVELGAWFQNHAYPHHSSLSPSGKWLSFARIMGYAVGEPPRMDPKYLYDGAPGWNPITFISETTIYSRFGKFVKSSDGSPTPFRLLIIGSFLLAATKSMANALNRPKGHYFDLKNEEIYFESAGRRRRFWTEPDLGLLDEKVWSAIVLVSGELVIARLGIVSCYEVGADLKVIERWSADLTDLYEGHEGAAFTHSGEQSG